jgi:MerR family transcriptional regulator, light-induced transcriptional regulator
VWSPYRRSAALASAVIARAALPFLAGRDAGLPVPVCVTGWEHPGQDGKPDTDRISEALWSVDPAVVRSATMVAAGLAEVASPGHSASLQARLAEPAAPGSADLLRASGLLERTLD